MLAQDKTCPEVARSCQSRRWRAILAHLLALEEVVGGELLHVTLSIEVAELGIRRELHQPLSDTVEPAAKISTLLGGSPHLVVQCHSLSLDCEAASDRAGNLRHVQDEDVMARHVASRRSTAPHTYLPAHGQHGPALKAAHCQTRNGSRSGDVCTQSSTAFEQHLGHFVKCFRLCDQKSTVGRTRRGRNTGGDRVAILHARMQQPCTLPAVRTDMSARIPS